MRTGTLTRLRTSDQGTEGELVLDSGWKCATLELPWRGDQENISCVKPCPGLPELKHLCKLMESPHHGLCYHVFQTDSRNHVLMHSATFAGATDAGYFAQLLGCMGLGERIIFFKAGAVPDQDKDQRGLTKSKDTVAAFEAELKGEDLELTVRWADSRPVVQQGAA